MTRVGRPPLTLLRFATHIGIAVGVLAVIIFMSPGIGSQPIGVLEAWGALFHPESGVHQIAFGLRLPRALMALTAGLTLALAGAVFQTLFRNVLATPYTLGISSGGSLGALIGIKLGLIGTFLNIPYMSWCSLAGSAAVLTLVLFLSRSPGRIIGNTLVLAGVAVGFFCSAMMMFVTYLADVRETFFVVRWMMGSLEQVGHARLFSILGPLVVCWVILCGCAQSLNQFELGDELAASRGVNPAALQLIAVTFASIATALVVSVCGPIGFVGMIVPQTVRLLLGRDHRLLLPATALWGAAFLIVCDWLARILPGWIGAWVGAEMTAAPLPIGVMTAVIGAPVFVYLLRRGSRT